jgi:hypothetical protein
MDLTSFFGEMARPFGGLSNRPPWVGFLILKAGFNIER